MSEVVPADYDNDGDTDLLVALAGGGLRVLGNDGGDAHRQLRMMLTGTRSNRTGLGVVVEVRAGAFRTSRTVHRLPVEIGVGDRERLDTVTIVWSDQIVQAEVDVPVAMGKPRSFTEPHVSAASCPYLYAWDGSGFRFVTDILGASPLGLRASDDRVIEADADEYVRIGSAERFPPRGGRYVVQVTEELREVLYLDEARLVIADHPADTEVHATDKLRPPPFAPSELVLLGNQRPLLAAFDDRGDDLTDRLRGIDGELFSPRLYKPQLRGWAHPFSVTLDFGPLPAKAPLVLAVTGWLQYGGATANVAASHDRALGSPFPVLECRTGDGRWHALDVVVGAPAGKTKTILVDLHGHLPSGARQMRLSSALEIHFDRIALLQRLDPARLRTERLTPVMADLHWRGFGCVVPKRAGQPSKPQHDCLLEAPPWRHVPAGWCTRYGDVRGLVSRRDDALVVMNAGDALTLAFEARMGAPQPGWRREFFLYSVGWDKDADYHVRSGRTVGPLPFHGLDDQTYGTSRASLNAAGARRGAWFERYNTRWVGPFPPRSSRDDAVGPVTSRER